MRARAQGERSAGPQARTKKELLSLKGDKLARHLKKGGGRTGRHSIATDLSLWAADDYHKFQETILMMHKQNQRLRLKDQALENKFRGQAQSTSLAPLTLSQLMSAELTDALNQQVPSAIALDGPELSQQDQDLRREVQESQQLLEFYKSQVDRPEAKPMLGAGGGPLSGRKTTLPKLIKQPDFGFRSQHKQQQYTMIKYPMEVFRKDKHLDMKLQTIMGPGRRLSAAQFFDSDYAGASP